MDGFSELRNIDGYDILATDNPQFELKLFSLIGYPDNPDTALHVKLQDPETGQRFEIVLARLNSLVADSSGENTLLFSGRTSDGLIASGWFIRNTSSEKIGEIRVLLQS